MGSRWGGGGTFDIDRESPYRPPHPLIWWPGQSVEPAKTPNLPHEGPMKQGLEDPGGFQEGFGKA